MTTTENDSPLLKSDTIGRVVTPPARREQLLDEFERSGLSGAKFAAQAGIKYPCGPGERVWVGMSQVVGHEWDEVIRQGIESEYKAGLSMPLPNTVSALGCLWARLKRLKLVENKATFYQSLSDEGAGSGDFRPAFFFSSG